MSPVRHVAVIAAALAGAVAPSALAQPGAARITVTLDNYSYGPSPLRLAAGKPVTLHFVNVSGKPHDFTAPSFFAAAVLSPADAAKIAKGRVRVESGASLDLRLVPRAGRYKVKCSLPFHALRGMKDDIIVS